MSRDPRIDPRVGDVLRDSDGQVRTVDAVSVEGWFRYRKLPSTHDRRRAVWITPSGWRLWAKDAEVVRVAGTANESDPSHLGTPEAK